MKTKALIRFVVTAKLICVFVFAYAKSWFSHDAAHFESWIPIMLCEIEAYPANGRYKDEPWHEKTAF